MRCKACNRMMQIRKNALGSFEDLCPICKSWIKKHESDDIYPDIVDIYHDSRLRDYEHDINSVISDIGLPIDLQEIDEDIMDRNHERPTDLFDNYEES